MSMPARLFLILAFLGATLAVQLGLIWHMRGGGDLEYAHLRKPLTQLPLTFAGSEDNASPAKYGPWLGKANPALEADIRTQLPFQPDDLLTRAYFNRDMTLGMNLYIVHSRQANDRRHNPELCIRDAAGAPEDLAANKILFVDADKKRPIQRFRFRTDAAQYVTVYYWHYTFARLPRAGETGLQAFYRRMNDWAPSITVQVSLSAELEQLEPVENGFLVSLDQALRDQHLPAGAVVGCDRIPIPLRRRK